MLSGISGKDTVRIADITGMDHGRSIAAETYNRLTLSGFLSILRMFLWLK